MKTTTKQYRVTELIKSLEVNQSIQKEVLITDIWGEVDYFITRSFDVMFITAKKQLSDREFKTHKGLITRIK